MCSMASPSLSTRSVSTRDSGGSGSGPEGEQRNDGQPAESRVVNATIGLSVTPTEPTTSTELAPLWEVMRS